MKGKSRMHVECTSDSAFIFHPLTGRRNTVSLVGKSYLVSGGVLSSQEDMKVPYVTIVVGAVLCFIGLFGYFFSNSENPSLTALIPSLFGAVLAVCGIIARNPLLRMHVMHVAVLTGLVGLVMAAARLSMKWGNLFSDDLSLARPPRMAFLMALVCLIYVVLCIRSFIVARRHRKASETAT
jgi:hypothetical protein